MITKFRIEPCTSGDRVALSQGTKVFINEQEIHGIFSIDVRYRVDEPVEAIVQLWGQELPHDALGKIVVPHPVSGELSEIKKIVFVDGETFEP